MMTKILTMFLVTTITSVSISGVNTTIDDNADFDIVAEECGDDFDDCEELVDDDDVTPGDIEDFEEEILSDEEVIAEFERNNEEFYMGLMEADEGVIVTKEKDGSYVIETRDMF